jgi:hypothetical protein
MSSIHSSSSRLSESTGEVDTLFIQAIYFLSFSVKSALARHSERDYDICEVEHV